MQSLIFLEATKILAGMQKNLQHYKARICMLTN